MYEFQYELQCLIVLFNIRIYIVQFKANIQVLRGLRPQQLPYLAVAGALNWSQQH